MSILKFRSTSALIAVAALMAAACSDFLKVENPNTVTASDVNPTSDATTLAASALQDFAAAYGTYVVFGGIFTGELYSADVNSPGNLTSVRLVDNTMTNGYLASMSKARVLASKVITALDGTSEQTSVNSAKAWMVAGYSFLSLAEYFCSATVSGGPLLNTQMMLDSAVATFTKAIDIGGTVGSADALQIKNAALVGRARAELWAGNKAAAIADANAVSAGFNYNLVFINDLTNITRLGNYVWHITFNISTLSAAPAFRNLTDPRVTTVPPSVNKLRPMDGLTDMWSIGKYQSYSAPIRLASKIEADYIAAEAQGPAAMLTLINARRAANNQPAYTGPTDDHSVLVEFLVQRTYEFYVEGKHMGDYRRYPNDLPFLTPAGTPYRKPNVPAYSDGKCWPISIQELTNNPNLKGQQGG
jgi:hypothetical protein